MTADGAQRQAVTSYWHTELRQKGLYHSPRGLSTTMALERLDERDMHLV
jgi:hypothetical protein